MTRPGSTVGWYSFAATCPLNLSAVSRSRASSTVNPVTRGTLVLRIMKGAGKTTKAAKMYPTAKEQVRKPDPTANLRLSDQAAPAVGCGFFFLRGLGVFFEPPPTEKLRLTFMLPQSRSVRTVGSVIVGKDR